MDAKDLGKIIVNGGDKVIEELNTGMSRSFRVFGGIGFLISIWVNNTLALKISLITFIFGAFSKVLEVLNKLYSKNVILQVFAWLTFTISYIFLINNQIQII